MVFDISTTHQVVVNINVGQSLRGNIKNDRQ